VIFRNKLTFYDEELLASSSTPKLEDHPFSAVRDCLFNIFAATLHAIRNLRTRYAVVTRDAPNMGKIEGNNLLGIDVDGRIILKWFLNK
jgi:hypothetical protein